MKKNIKITSPEIWVICGTTLYWAFINLTLNLIGLWIAKLLNQTLYEYPDNVLFEFFAPILVQSLVFGLFFGLATSFFKKHRLSKFAFVAVQFVVFHLIFIFNLRFSHGIHFVTSYHNIGLKYLSYFGQYFTDILYLYFPITGNFQNGIFAPDNLGTFYIHWILLNLIYYFGISWLSVKAYTLFSSKK